MQFSLGAKSVDLKKQQTARKIASLLKNPSTLRPKNQSQAKGSHQKSVKGYLTFLITNLVHVSLVIVVLMCWLSHCRETNLNNIASTTNLIQENQAIKRQKLDDGKSRQVSQIVLKSACHSLHTSLHDWNFFLLIIDLSRFSIQNQQLCSTRQEMVLLTLVSTYALQSLSTLRRKTERCVVLHGCLYTFSVRPSQTLFSLFRFMFVSKLHLLFQLLNWWRSSKQARETYSSRIDLSWHWQDQRNPNLWRPNELVLWELRAVQNLRKRCWQRFPSLKLDLWTRR